MADSSSSSPRPETAPVGFCQQCGKPLNAESIRRVGPAVYCEPCLVERLAGTEGGAGPVPYTPVAGATVPPAGTPFTSTSNYPNPGLAALLGFIPGVGAMYNEQYAKGIVHLIVFAVLVSLSDHSGIFGLMVAGWIFYMVIEAHHTARARRDGTPLPNPFGLNDVGERLGFGRAWPGGANVAGVAQSVAETVSGAAYRASASPIPPPAPAYAPAAEPGWGAPTDQYPPPAYGAPAYMQTPYQPVGYPAPPVAPVAEAAFGAQVPFTSPVPPIPPVDYSSGPAPQSRFPTGAVWLIALGLLFLLATTGIFNGLPGESLVGFVLLAFGGWVFTRSYFDKPAYAPSFRSAGPEIHVSQLLFALRASLMLLIAGTLTSLDGFRVLRWYQSWPLLIIGAGLLALLNRIGWQMRAALLAKQQSGPDVHEPWSEGYYPGTTGERADTRGRATPVEETRSERDNNFYNGGR